jgi:hypothetical protein
LTRQNTPAILSWGNFAPESPAQGISKMNMHVTPASAVASPCLIGEPSPSAKKSARAKNALRTGEIVAIGDYDIAVVLNFIPGPKGYHRLMSSIENDDGEFRPHIFAVRELRVVRLSDVIPDEKLEDAAWKLHALLTSTDVGSITKPLVDLVAFEATLMRRCLLVFGIATSTLSWLRI